MVHFRYWFPLGAVLGLMIGAPWPVDAQPAFSCRANAGVPPIVRGEGLTELVGDLILNCSGGVPTAAGAAVPQVNIQIFLNTTVTSRLLSEPWSEALLLIDEPSGTDTTAGNLRYCTTNGGCPMTGVGTDGGVNYLAGDSRNGNPANVFQGRQAGANQIVWLGVPIDPPGANRSRIIRITNVRANAHQLGVSTTLIPTQILMFVSASSSTSIPINNPQQTVGYVQRAMLFSTRTLSSANYMQCASNNGGAASGSSSTLSSTRHILRFTEGFASAFQPRSLANGNADESATPGVQNRPSQDYFTESGFYNPFVVSAGNNGGLTSNIGQAGLAAQGTRLVARFTNVPAGAVLYASLYGVTSNAAPALTGATNGSNSPLRLIATAVGDSGGGPFAAVGASHTSIESGLVIASAPIALRGGTGAAVWEVMAADAYAIQEFEVAVSVAYVADEGNGLPGLGTATVAGGFGPVRPVTTAEGMGPQPFFAEGDSSQMLFNLNACSTNLLFPFLTNRAGMDSGIAIANTSADPSRAVRQAGPCKLNYYGDTAGGGVAPAAQTSLVIPAGKNLTATLSSGGNYGIGATPGFQGYMIAQCNFQYAHGLAYLSDVGANRISEAYQALVMDAAQERRVLPAVSTAPPRLGNTSPTLQAGTPRNWPADGIVQRWIPRGVFEYGCSPGDTECLGDEKPTRLLVIPGFWMQESEVTQAAFTRVMWGYNPSNFKGPQLPVENVTWFEAKTYCEVVGLRLPEEDEWEYAARGGTTGSRYGELDSIAWYVRNSGLRTQQVKTKLPNGYGLHDMFGNVMEWTASAFYQLNVLRGGSWYDFPQLTRASFRYRDDPTRRSSYNGFRCVGN